MMCIFRCNHHPTCDDGADEEGCFPKKFNLKTVAIIIGAGVAGVFLLGECILMFLSYKATLGARYLAILVCDPNTILTYYSLS